MGLLWNSGHVAKHACYCALQSNPLCCCGRSPGSGRRKAERSLLTPPAVLTCVMGDMPWLTLTWSDTSWCQSCHTLVPRPLPRAPL